MFSEKKIKLTLPWTCFWMLYKSSMLSAITGRSPALQMVAADVKYEDSLAAPLGERQVRVVYMVSFEQIPLEKCVYVHLLHPHATMSPH